MIVSNIYMRVLLLGTAQGLGTAFTIEVGDQQYLVTARHVLPDPEGPNQVTLSGPIQIDAFDSTPLPGVHPEADVAVCAVDGRLTKDFRVTAGMKDILYGQGRVLPRIPSGGVQGFMAFAYGATDGNTGVVLRNYNRRVVEYQPMEHLGRPRSGSPTDPAVTR